MLSCPPSHDKRQAYLSSGGIIVAMLRVEGPIAAARSVSRQLCADLLGRFPDHLASRSATAGLSVVALSKSTRVGVDVERIDPDLKLDAELLAAALHRDERATVQPHEVERFLQLWTCKESALKAAGVGLALPAATVHVGWNTRVWQAVSFGARASPAHVRSLAAPPGYVAAIATLGVKRDVRHLAQFTTD